LRPGQRGAWGDLDSIPCNNGQTAYREKSDRYPEYSHRRFNLLAVKTGCSTIRRKELFLSLRRKLLWRQLRQPSGLQRGLFGSRALRLRLLFLNVSIRLSTFLLALLLPIAIPSLARSGELYWEAPEDCQTRTYIQAQAEQLVQRNLVDIRGIDFGVTIAADANDQWRVRVVTIVGGQAEGERNISGKSCTEVSDAAGIAIAMAVRTFDKSEQTTMTTNSPAKDSEPVQQVIREQTRIEPPEPPKPTARWNTGVAAAAVFDWGLLPKGAAGIQTSAQIERNHWGLRGFGAVFANVEASAAASTAGGEFGLATFGAQLLYEVPISIFRIEGGIGLDGARILARGRNIGRTYERHAWVAAIHPEVGFGLVFQKQLSLFLRIGVTAPLSRPSFVIDGATPVHQVGNLNGRGLLALQYAF
jgi:hypothetical protein